MKQPTIKTIEGMAALLVLFILFLASLHFLVDAIETETKTSIHGELSQQQVNEVMGRQHGNTNEMPVR